MSTHFAEAHWIRETSDFAYASYSRDHDLHVGASTRIAASAAEGYGGTAERTNPEELLVAALSSCHMLTFLAICARKSIVVDRYDDRAEGHLEKGPDGKLWVTRVIVRPKVRFAPASVIDDEAFASLHQSAHRGCFIAASVKTEVTVEASRE